MDFKIVAFSAFGTVPVSIKDMVARFPRQDKSSLYELARKEALVEVTLRCRGLAEGSKSENPCRLRIRYENNFEGYLEVVSLQDPRDSTSTKLFVDLASGDRNNIPL